jgi:hypothetical protein
MSKTKGNKTLSDKLAELANPTPQFIDPEDEYNEGNSKFSVCRNSFDNCIKTSTSLHQALTLDWKTTTINTTKLLVFLPKMLPIKNRICDKPTQNYWLHLILGMQESVSLGKI